MKAVIHKERAAPSGTAPSTVPPRRSGSAEPDPRDGDPTHESRRVRHVTMRHWITSFTLLNDGLVCRGLPAQFKHLYARCAKGGEPGHARPRRHLNVCWHCQEAIRGDLSLLD